VGCDAFDAEGKRVLGEETRDRRRKAASPRRRQDEVTDLDDPALVVEMVQRGSADNLAATSVDGRKSQQPPFLGENR